MTDINLKRQLTPFEWLQMPVEVRSLFIKWFKIPRTGGAIVQGDKVLSDGHNIEDLSVVSLASLQAFLHTDETHWDNLLQLTINKMENYIDGELVSDKVDGPFTPAVSKRGRPKKTEAVN
jgi:hypothetical protein